MAETYKILGQADPAATTETAVYTVPGGTSAVISSITLCNRNTNLIYIRLSVSKAGAATTNKDYIHYGLPMNASDTLVLTLGMTLSAGDVVRVYTDTATLSVNIFGTEIV